VQYAVGEREQQGKIICNGVFSLEATLLVVLDLLKAHVIMNTEKCKTKCVRRSNEQDHGVRLRMALKRDFA